MKKRLLSMLMAVLMIASLVPAVALADSTVTGHVNCDVLTVNVKADPAKAQSGYVFTYCNTDNRQVGELEFTAFADKSVINKCAHDSWKTDTLQKSTCGKAEITITYCSKCGEMKTKGLEIAEKVGQHVYTDFHVYQAPTCIYDGWGYVVCDICKEPVFVEWAGNWDETYNKDSENDESALYYLCCNEDVTVTTAKKTEVYNMFAATNPGHADKDKFVTPTKDVLNADGSIKYKAKVEAKHDYSTVNGGRALEAWKIELVNGRAQAVKYDVDKALTGGDRGTAGYTGDSYCPYCEKAGIANEIGGSVVYGHDVPSLYRAHKDAKALSIAKGDEGYYPYLDKEGNKHDGKTDRIYCNICKTYFGGDVLPYDEYCDLSEAKVGTIWTQPAVAPTCEAEGQTAQVWTLSDAGWVITKKADTVAPTGHHWVKLDDVKATCTKPGYKFDNVYVCDNTYVDDNGKTRTCGYGTEYNRTYKPGTVIKQEWNGETWDYLPQFTQIPPLHWNDGTAKVSVLVEPTCSTKGLSVKHCSICNYVFNHYTVPATGHVAGDPVNAKEATCTEVGYTGDLYCKWCNTAMEKGKEIPMKEHTSVEVKAVEATCTTDGMTAGTKCSVCDKVLTGCEVVKALGHDFKDGKCTRCGEKDPNYVAPEFKDAASIRDYAKDAVAWAAKEGIVKGDDNGNFLPTADITRQDFVTMLWRLKGSVASEKALTFGDKADIKDYAQTAVAWAVENGYIKGRDNGNFDPAAKITRAEIVAILNRIAENAKAEKAADFTDIATHWAKDAIAWAAEAGIVNGVGNNMFAPNDNASRQDTVVMLYKFVNLK